MSVKMFLMWNSTMLIDAVGEANVETSLVEANNLVVLRVLQLFHHLDCLTLQHSSLISDMLCYFSFLGIICHTF